MPSIPDTIVGAEARGLYMLCNDIRRAIKSAAEITDGARSHPAARTSGETVANITLAYRHLEDASMRLGKALQALDGGVSVYDKATTVGAPDQSPEVALVKAINDGENRYRQTVLGQRPLPGYPAVSASASETPE